MLMNQLRASLVLEREKRHERDHGIANLVPINPRAVAGNNRPPGAIEVARGFYAIIAGFLKETPVIQSYEEAKKGANLAEQSHATLGAMEDERKKLVTPLNDEVKAINDQYRKPRESIESIRDELNRRRTVFTEAEEARREAIAEAARIAAEQAERAAREAEEIEAEAKACADVGEIGVEVATAITNADRAFDTFKRADREAARAEKQIPVRLNGGMGRTVSMRSKETLTVVDAPAAIAAMGLTETIADAILSSARAYKKLNGELPDGIASSYKRSF